MEFHKVTIAVAWSLPDNLVFLSGASILSHFSMIGVALSLPTSSTIFCLAFLELMSLSILSSSFESTLQFTFFSTGFLLSLFIFLSVLSTSSVLVVYFTVFSSVSFLFFLEDFLFRFASSGTST